MTKNTIISSRDMAKIRGQVKYERDQTALDIIQHIFRKAVQEKGYTREHEQRTLKQRIKSELVDNPRIPKEFLEAFDLYDFNA